MAFASRPSAAGRYLADSDEAGHGSDLMSATTRRRCGSMQ